MERTGCRLDMIRRDVGEGGRRGLRFCVFVFVMIVRRGEVTFIVFSEGVSTFILI